MTNNSNVRLFALVFVCVSKTPTSLIDILDTADYINRSILTREDLETSLSWLLQQGLITRDQNHFQFTPKGSALFDRSRGENKTFSAFIENVEKEFNEYPVESISKTEIREEDYQKALCDYNDQFWETYQKLTENKGKPKQTNTL